MRTVAASIRSRQESTALEWKNSDILKNIRFLIPSPGIANWNSN